MSAPVVFSGAVLAVSRGPGHRLRRSGANEVDMRMRRSRTGLIALLLLTAVFQARADELLTRARALQEAGEPQAAIELLLPEQTSRAGEPEYDLLLGVSALEAGRDTEAVFALERVLALQPGNLTARAQLARAYYNLKEFEAARREFEAVRAQAITAETARTIERYLSAIRQAGGGARLTARFFLEFAAGYDSNVNGATDLSLIAIPAFNGLEFALDASAQEQDDAFFSFAIGAALNAPLSARTAIIGGLGLYQRLNPQQSDFSTGYLDGWLGLSFRRGRDTWTAIGQLNTFLLYAPDYSGGYRNAAGATVQWTRDLTPYRQWTAYLQYAALHYPNESERDTDRLILGLGHAFAVRGGDPSAYVGVYGGVERERDGKFDFLGHRPLGIRLGGQKALSDKYWWFASLGYERRDYRGEDPSFQTTRRDRQFAAATGIHFLLENDWRLSPQVSYIRNASNIELNEYDRWQAYATLRYDW